jgi:hypothetical protein
MSQVEKSTSALVRAFLAIPVLELEDMVVRLFRPSKLTGVHGDRWTFAWASRSRSGVPFGGWLRARDLPAEAGNRALHGFCWGLCPEEQSRRAILVVALLSPFEITHAILSPATYQSHLARVAARGRALFGFRYDGTEETATRRRAVTLEPLRCGWPSLRSVFHPLWPNCDFQNRRTTKLRRATGVRANQHLAHLRRAGADT